MTAVEPPINSDEDWAPDHPHPVDCRCAKCECDRNPPVTIGPPSDCRRVAALWALGIGAGIVGLALWAMILL